MQEFVRKFNDWAYRNDSFVMRWRAARMHAFQRHVSPPARARIVDLGGSPLVWKLLQHEYDITIVNLPGFNDSFRHEAGFTFVDGDACDLTKQFPERSFDVAFSNSVIEHVGNESRQFAFAEECKRLALAYWVQTPSSKFPLEAHTGVPFYWSLPAGFRRHLHENWKKRFPVWFEMIAETRVLTRSRMESLFPDAQVFLESKVFFEKSYAFYRKFETP